MGAQICREIAEIYMINVKGLARSADEYIQRELRAAVQLGLLTKREAVEVGKDFAEFRAGWQSHVGCDIEDHGNIKLAKAGCDCEKCSEALAEYKSANGSKRLQKQMDETGLSAFQLRFASIQRDEPEPKYKQMQQRKHHK